MSDKLQHRDRLNNADEHQAEQMSLSQRVQDETGNSKITWRPVITEGVNPQPENKQLPPNPGHVSGLERSEEMDQRVTQAIQAMVKMSPSDAAQEFKKLGSEPDLQKYDVMQALDALVRAQDKFDPDRRFVIDGLSLDGSMRMRDNLQKPTDENLSSAAMYSEKELQDLKSSGVKADRDKLNSISEAFAKNDLSKMTPQQMQELLEKTCAEMKANHAKPNTAANKLSRALDDSGQKFDVDEDDGRLTIRTKKDFPLTEIRLSPGS